MSVKSPAGPITAGEILHTALAGRGGDRRQLQTPSADSSASRTGADHDEDLVAAIVAGVLGVEDVDRNIPFSALGGDSLLATSVLSRVWRAFEVKLPLSALLPDTSVATLGAVVRCERESGGRTTPPLVGRTATGAEEASPNQAAIWVVESLGGVGALYNIPYGLRLDGPLDVAVLRRSLDGLLQRHEALQMRFEVRVGRLVQEPCELESLALPIVDLTAVEPATAREARALSLAGEEVRRPFDLGRPPLLRALLIELAREAHLLVLTIHHIVCDAWSINLLLRDLSERYRAAGELERSPTGPGFLDFVAWERALLAGVEGDRLANQWRMALSENAATTRLPTDRERPELPSGAGAIERIELDGELIGALRRCSGSHGVTLYMTLLSAYAVALAQDAGCKCVIVGSPVANRGQESLEGIVGYLANMLPLCIDMSGDPTLRELLVRVRTVTLAGHDHQALPFAQLVRELAPPREPGCNPVFQLGFILNDMTAAPLGDIRVAEVLLHTGTSKLDLTCYLDVRRRGLSGYRSG